MRLRADWGPWGGRHVNCEDPHADGLCPACRAAIRAEARAYYGQPMKRPGSPDARSTNWTAPDRWAGPRTPKRLPDTPSAPGGPVTDRPGAYSVDSPTNGKDSSRAC